MIIDGLQAVPLNAEYDFIDDTSVWAAGNLRPFDAVVLAKINCKSPVNPDPWLTDSVQREFVDFVERGGGLTALHAGTVGYNDDATFLALVGGVFVHHPEPCTVTIDTAGQAPINAQVDSFDIFDEHYFMASLSSDADIFLTATSVHGLQPAGWTRRQGLGRVCVVTPGHFADVWRNASYQSIVARAIAWCSGCEAVEAE